MDYGLPKTLPATGAAVIAGTLTDQIVYIGGAAVVVFVLALLARKVWRKNKTLGE